MLKAARWTVAGLLAFSVVVLAFAIGYVVRGDGDSSSSPTANADSGSQATNFSNLNNIMKLLQDNYVDPDKLDRTTLYQAAINGMLQTLSDSGVFYVDPNTVKTSVGPSGSFEGIGATVATQNNQIVIVSPIDGSPAQRAGIKAGDIVLAVDGESTEGWTQDKAVVKIRGPRGTKVQLKVRHTDGQEETIEIERDQIQVSSVSTDPPGGVLKDGAGNTINDIGYIQIREFTLSTDDEMQKALKDVVSSGKKGLILDLRNDPGGLLDTTTKIADEFLTGGTILTEKERDGTETKYTAHAGGAATDIPVVLIMNRFSASGSEVLAAALHDNGRAKIVGEKSFGKGTVNISKNLSDGGQLYVSIAKWYTPDGTQIDGVGITPDFPIKLSNDDIDQNRDVQLFKALDVLRGTNTTPAETPAASTTAASDATASASDSTPSASASSTPEPVATAGG
ncbi:MAG TPA: S41 family peptidase [Dehalococcoidia bacterium]|nr:S41 family peptidase [Dehalococcoidia bacterium]